MLRISLSFLATSKEQLKAVKNTACKAVEAVLFNKEDLYSDKWEESWLNILEATKLYGSKNVVFHFPVNYSDYVADKFVYLRLEESYKRACDLNLAGIVVHSNRVRLINDWREIDLKTEREKVIEKLANVLNSYKNPYNTWIGLENMPVMDNYGIEIDPIFCYPEDFELIQETNIGITWDICHYTNTMANVKEILTGKQNKKHYPNIQETTLEAFCSLKEKIVHWHLSAFQGIANPDTKDECKEGCLPYISTLGENTYKKAVGYMNSISFNQIVTLELQEVNFLDRLNGKKGINWLQQQIKTE